MFKSIIKKYFSKQQHYCFEKHNEFGWYFSVEHPCPPVSNDNSNPFFTKYGFLILKNIYNSDVDYKLVLRFLIRTTYNIANSKVVFGEKNIFFKDDLKFIKLEKGDILIFNPLKNNFELSYEQLPEILEIINQ